MMNEFYAGLLSQAHRSAFVVLKFKSLLVYLFI